MKKIVVMDVAAEVGGALTILKSFHEYVKDNCDDIEWHFLLGTVHLQASKNIITHNYPFVKKNWIMRLLFEYVVAPCIVKKINPDCIFSLQNLKVKYINIPQFIYLHQPLPFSDIKIKISESKVLWFYQKIMSILIKKDIISAKHVFVQTEWMKKAVISQAQMSAESVSVVAPNVEFDSRNLIYNQSSARRIFFYPASFIYYKNHAVILKAIERLKQDSIDDFEVLFTGNEDDGRKCGITANENVKFIGTIPHDEVIKLLCKSTLIFPSKIETFGLPLLEARMCKSFILASNTSFSHEILDAYENAFFFNVDDTDKLYMLMKNIITEKIFYKNVSSHTQRYNGNGWSEIFNFWR